MRHAGDASSGLASGVERNLHGSGQDFTPTPMTTSSVMFYTGLDPKNLDTVYVERDMEKKKEQKSFFFKKGRR